jgi:hypothetical protein
MATACLVSTSALTSDASGFVSVPATATTVGDQTVTATAVDAQANITTPTATAILRWGVTTVNGLGAKGSALVNFLNATGKTAVIYEGNTKLAKLKIAKATQTQKVKIAKKGIHKLTVKIGTFTWLVTATVS